MLDVVAGRRRTFKTDSQWLRLALAAAGLGVSLMLASVATGSLHVLLWAGGALALIGAYISVAVLIVPLPLPQLLAERRTRAFRRRVGAFIAEGHALNSRRVTTDDELTEFEAAYADWVERTQAWLSENVGAPDSAAFEHAIGTSAEIVGSFDRAHNDLRLELSWQLDVLHDLRTREA